MSASERRVHRQYSMSSGQQNSKLQDPGNGECMDIQVTEATSTGYWEVGHKIMGHWRFRLETELETFLFIPGWYMRTIFALPSVC